MTKKQKKTLVRILVSLVLLVAAWIVSRVFSLPWWAEAAVFAVPYLLIGYDVIRKAALNILHGQVFDEQFLMVVATFGAFAVREYPEAAAVMLFYQIGEWFQGIAVGKSRKSIRALLSLRPDSATVLRGGIETEVSPEEVGKGEILLVRPGERVPLDGVILEGSTSLNTSALTGESLPVDKKEGDAILSGSVNLTGAIRVRTSGEYAESTVARILALAENASEKKAKVEGFITRFARVYTPCVVIGALLLALLPPLLLRQSFSAWITRALVFLVVSCPCALVVSVPLTFFGGIGGASKEGILIKGADAIERFSAVDTAVFDKTGTLTEGVFALRSLTPIGVTEEELLRLAAYAEAYSDHPIARSLREAYGKEIDRSLVSGFREDAGHGVYAVVGKEAVYAGNAEGVRALGLEPAEGGEGTVIHVVRGNTCVGFLCIGDTVKKGSKEALLSMKTLGVIKTLMLTGDSAQAAEEAARDLAIDEIRAGLLPADKAQIVSSLLDGGRRVAFAGDGLNDAPVLALADVGIAMGMNGTDAAIEAADLVLMDDDPRKIALALSHCRRTMRIVWENVIFALAVKLAILLLGALGIAGMWIAVFGDVGVLVIAVCNAMRALKVKK